MNNDDDIKEMYNSLGEAVMSLLESQESLSNHAILTRLDQFASDAADETKIMSYWQAKKLFRPLPPIMTPSSEERGPADKKSVRLPYNRFRVRKMPAGDDSGS